MTGLETTLATVKSSILRRADSGTLGTLQLLANRLDLKNDQNIDVPTATAGEINRIADGRVTVQYTTDPHRILGNHAIAMINGTAGNNGYMSASELLEARAFLTELARHRIP